MKTLIAKLIGVIFSPKRSQKTSNSFNKMYTVWKSKDLGKVGANAHFRYPLHIYGGSNIEIGDNFYSCQRLRIESICETNDKPIVRIGNNVMINYDCHIGGCNSLIIGNDVLIGSKVLITDHSHGEISSDSLNLPPSLRSIFSKGPVVIEDNVWIGEGAAILPGVTLGKNCIIGANSVVTRSIPPNCVACGNPARIVKVIK